MKDRSNSLFKTNADYFEFLFKWKEFEKDCIPNLTKLLIKRHPAMLYSHESFLKPIYTLCEHTCYEIFEHIWRIVIHDRQGKTPNDFPTLDFDDLKEYMKTWNAPEPVTEERYLDQNYFKKWDETKRQEYIKERNEENYNNWLHGENEIKEFTAVMQELLLALAPELMDIDGNWWIVYDYRFRMQHFFSAKANRIEHTIECGLTGEWLDKPPAELSKKFEEIHLKEWHEKYGKKDVA